MVVITKKFGTYVSLRNLDLSPKKIHCTLGKMPFSQEKFIASQGNYLFLEGTFLTSWGTCLGLALNLFFPKEIISQMQLT
jgi:hypothetical protein